MKKAIRILGIVAAVLLGLAALLYFGGLIGQLLVELHRLGESRRHGRPGADSVAQPWSLRLYACRLYPFRLKGMGVLLVAGAALALYFKFSDRFGGSGQDPRGFTVSKEGTYGTASWMGERELKEVLTVEPLAKAEDILLGKRGRQSRLPAGGYPAQPAHRRVWRIRYRASPGASSGRPSSISSAGESPPLSPTARGSFTQTRRSCSAAMGMR